MRLRCGRRPTRLGRAIARGSSTAPRPTGPRRRREQWSPRWSARRRERAGRLRLSDPWLETGADMMIARFDWPERREFSIGQAIFGPLLSTLFPEHLDAVKEPAGRLLPHRHIVPAWRAAAGLRPRVSPHPSRGRPGWAGRGGRRSAPTTGLPCTGRRWRRTSAQRFSMLRRAKGGSRLPRGAGGTLGWRRCRL